MPSFPTLLSVPSCKPVHLRGIVEVSLIVKAWESVGFPSTEWVLNIFSYLLVSFFPQINVCGFFLFLFFPYNQ